MRIQKSSEASVGVVRLGLEFAVIGILGQDIWPERCSRVLVDLRQGFGVYRVICPRAPVF